MGEQTKFGMQCPEFEAALAEALDGHLSGPELEKFQAHRSACPTCGPMFAEAEAGQRWLHMLEAVEPPAGMVDKILRATTGVAEVHHPEPAPVAESWWGRLKARLPRVAVPVFQPRFAMSFGMALFSVTVIMNVAGFKLADLRYVDLRPSAVVRQYYETTGKLVKYYENIRFVYEIESRVQQLKRATTPAEESPTQPKKEKPNRDNTSGEPDHNNQNYSREESQQVLAAAPGIRPSEPEAGLPGTPGDLRLDAASTKRRLS